MSETFLRLMVSTHSRPKAAGHQNHHRQNRHRFQHTAARRRLDPIKLALSGHSEVSTHSRPKAAGYKKGIYNQWIRCFNTQPPEGGWPFAHHIKTAMMLFQHTAARRRLEVLRSIGGVTEEVSTHSRPKAAGRLLHRHSSLHGCFNTQPPEGGWVCMTP